MLFSSGRPCLAAAPSSFPNACRTKSYRVAWLHIDQEINWLRAFSRGKHRATHSHVNELVSNAGLLQRYTTLPLEDQLPERASCDEAHRKALCSASKSSTTRTSGADIAAAPRLHPHHEILTRSCSVQIHPITSLSETSANQEERRW